MRVCAIQTPISEDPRINLETAIDLCRRAVSSGGTLDLICFPELFYAQPEKEEVERVAIDLRGEVFEAFSSLARETSANFVCGSFPERSPDGKFYNTCLVINRQGELAGVYRKTHLFDIHTHRESATFTPGGESLLFDADGIKCGVMVCYELRFPEIARNMALKGAKLIIVPSAFLSPRHDHWSLLIRASALQNQVYVMGVNLYGQFRKDQFFGRSMVVDPWGCVMAQCQDKASYVVAEIDIDYLEDVRKRFPVLKQRRPELYS